MLFPIVWPVSVWGPVVLPTQPAPAGQGTGPTGISSAALPAGRWSRWSGACVPSSVSHWPSEPPRLAPLSLHRGNEESYFPVGTFCENLAVLSPSSSPILYNVTQAVCDFPVKQWSGSVCWVSTEQFVQMSSTKIAPATTTQSFKEIPPALWTYNFGLKVPQTGRKTEIYRSFSCSLEACLYATLHICTVNLVFYLFTGSFKTNVRP